MFDADPRVLKKKQSIIDVGQRTQLDIINGELRRNKEVLTNLRLENTQLHASVQQAIRGKHRISSDEYFRREEEVLHNKLCLLKRSMNSVKGKKEELIQEIERTVEETAFVIKEGDATIDESSALGQKIRALENRLDKCLIKHNEVNAIRRTYETLLERLQQEKTGFDTQLFAMEKTLHNKEKDLSELNTVASDAAKGRDAAKADVLLLKTQLAKERRAQKKDIEERQAFVHSKREQLARKSRRIQEMIEKDEERRARARMALCVSQKKKVRVSPQKQLQPEELERQQQQRESYNRLRDITMSNNVNEVILKLRERRDANVQLLSTVSEAEQSYAILKAERERLQAEWNELQQKNGGITTLPQPQKTPVNDDLAVDGSSVEKVLEHRALVRRRVLEEFDTHLNNRKNELEEMQRAQDALGQLLVDVDTGVQHLAQKIAVYGESLRLPFPSFSEDLAPSSSFGCGLRENTTVEVLRSCGMKLQHLLSELQESEVSAAAKCLGLWRGSVPDSNVRVQLGSQGVACERSDTSIGRDGATGSPEREWQASLDEVAGGRRKWLAGTSMRTDVVEDYPENEIHSRHELKMMSIAMVERERKKARKQLQRRSKEETS